jgi:hypothetical protein
MERHDLQAASTEFQNTSIDTALAS